MSNHIGLLRSYIDEWMAGRESTRLLEAGCGSCSWLNLDDQAHVVGIDISQNQLNRNELIHEAIHGDITTYRFEPMSFDLIVSIDVLEHIDRPESALANLRGALAPGGLLVIKVPNALSWKGLFTKFTPHRFHVWVYRKFRGRPNAGTEDVGPFKTYLRTTIRPRALLRWGKRHDLSPIYEDYYQSPDQIRIRRMLGPLDLVVRLFDGLARWLSRGEISLTRTEYIIVLKSREASSSSNFTRNGSLSQKLPQKAPRAMESSG